ncbi:expressed unknown protein [Seminavis robusta]|uniref:Uncharacterized protein n=1 Tax=Seminavis robusta TaxID=568900 RepID=A0A9N8F375_9STRA|nr:expressed unknown protein [Seminavis robusta]|eukprot:Sro2654_g333830.1 n/a (389) ;mRNA; f:9993-11159
MISKKGTLGINLKAALVHLVFVLSVPVCIQCFASESSFRKSSETVLHASSSSSPSSVNVLEILESSTVIDPRTGASCPALEGLCCAGSRSQVSNNPLPFFVGKKAKETNDQKALIVVASQLGDFDSAEYAELLAGIQPELERANVALRIIGIGPVEAAKRFAQFAGLPLDVMRVDPEGNLHRALQLHGGPDWDIPSFVPDTLLQWFVNYTGATEENTQQGRALVARTWLNYMAMCAGIAAPDTLGEIVRGYIGDRSAPERIRPDETVRVGDDLIAVTGVTDVKLGPIEYQSLWKNEKGYQRPAELATVRLRVMVEVLSNFKEYVPDQKHLHLRGATFIFDADGNLEFEHRDTGVLAYSKTMPRPLTFLQPYIGSKALNPLQLGDNSPQ